MQTPQQQQQRQPPQYLVIRPQQQQHQQQQPQQHYVQQQPPQQQHYVHPQQQQPPQQVQQQQYVQQHPVPTQHVIVHHQPPPRPVVQQQHQQHHYVQQQQHHPQQQQHVVVHHQQQQQQPHPQQQGPPHQGPRIVQIQHGMQPRMVNGQQVRFVRVHRPPMNQHGPQGGPQGPPPQGGQPPYRMQHQRPVMMQQGHMVRSANGQPLRILRPGQQIRIVTQGPTGGPHSVLRGPRPNIIQHYNQRPPNPPPPPQGQNDIVYDVEHVFREGGKEYRKMPVLVDGKTMWVDCVDINPEDKNNTVIMNLDLNNATAPGSDPNKTNSVINNHNQRPPGMPAPNGPQQPQGGSKSAKDFSESEKAAIVKDVIENLISPAELSKRHNVGVSSIRNWVKESGAKLPSRYKVVSSTPKTSSSPS